MRRGFALAWLGATAVVSAIVGFFSYQAGWAAGLATKVPEGAAAPYYYPPHFFGFGFFGLLPFLFFLFVLWLVFRAGRWWGPWRWGTGLRDYNRFRGVTPPPTDDPLNDWPQRPPSERPAPGQRQ